MADSWLLVRDGGCIAVMADGWLSVRDGGLIAATAEVEIAAPIPATVEVSPAAVPTVPTVSAAEIAVTPVRPAAGVVRSGVMGVTGVGQGVGGAGVIVVKAATQGITAVLFQFGLGLGGAGLWLFGGAIGFVAGGLGKVVGFGVCGAVGIGGQKICSQSIGEPKICSQRTGRQSIGRRSIGEPKIGGISPRPVRNRIATIAQPRSIGQSPHPSLKPPPPRSPLPQHPIRVVAVSQPLAGQR